MHGHTCSCTYSNKQIHHQYNSIIQHYHSRRHVICVPSWPRIKEEQPQMNPVERKFSCMGGSRLSGTMSCNGKLMFRGTRAMNSKKIQKVCLLVAPGTPLDIFFASLSIVGECWISVFQAVAVKLLRDASHDLALPGIPVLQCQLSCLELFPKSLEPWDAPTTFFQLSANGTCDVSRLGCTLSRCGTLKREDPLAGITHLKYRKKLPDTSSGSKVSVSQQIFSYINPFTTTHDSIIIIYANDMWFRNKWYPMVMAYYVWWLPDCHRWGYRQQLTWRVTGERKDALLHANGVSCHENPSLQLQLFLESRTWRMAELLNCTDHQLLLKDLMEQIAWPPPFRPIHRLVTDLDEDKQQNQCHQ